MYHDLDACFDQTGSKDQQTRLYLSTERLENTGAHPLYVCPLTPLHTVHAAWPGTDMVQLCRSTSFRVVKRQG